MPEIVTTYLLSDPNTPIAMQRDAFYEEQIGLWNASGQPTRSVAVVQALVFVPPRGLILQKRSENKRHNPGLFDKTLGGHIRFGDTPTYTLMVETLQELEVPSIVLEGEEEFRKTFELLRTFLRSTAIVQHIDGPRTYTSMKFIRGETVGIANTYHFYLGAYDGAIRPADKEATGILYQNYPELLEGPELFTADLQHLLKEYAREIEAFLEMLG